jgi:signal peptidase I
MTAKTPVASKAKRKKSAGGTLLELAIIVVVALLLALGIQAILIKPYRIPSPSMEPTLDINQRVLVNRIGHELGDTPSVGDIVVFHPPTGASSNTCGVRVQRGQACARPTPKESNENFIKRVVAGPGDTIAIRDGHVMRNGKLQKESFIRPCAPGQDCNFPKAIRIPPGHWFMMGDNRGLSDDSRFWGPVPKKWIIGGAFATYWPLDRIGIF